MGAAGAISWDPQYHLEFGDWLISVHSFGIALGYVAGYLLLRHRALRRNRWHPEISDAVIVAIPGVLIGARIGFALPHWITGNSLPWEAVSTLQFTNISFIGGLVGGLATGGTWLAYRRISLRPIAGILGESVAIGLLIARLGDVIVADHLGRPTSWAMGYELPPGAAPNGACLQAGDVCHSTALYELLLLALLLVGVFLARRKRRSEGEVLAILIGGYSFLRFALVEPFRVTTRPLGLTGSQWACIGGAIVAVGLLLWARRRPRRSSMEGVAGAAPATARPPAPVPALENGVVSDTTRSRGDQPQDATISGPQGGL